MIFEVLIVASDTAGNEDTYHYRYVEASSLEEAQRFFPHTGMFLHFEVRPLTPDPLPARPLNHSACVTAYSRLSRGY